MLSEIKTKPVSVGFNPSEKYINTLKLLILFFVATIFSLYSDHPVFKRRLGGHAGKVTFLKGRLLQVFAELDLAIGRGNDILRNIGKKRGSYGE